MESPSSSSSSLSRNIAKKVRLDKENSLPESHRLERPGDDGARDWSSSSSVSSYTKASFRYRDLNSIQSPRQGTDKDLRQFPSQSTSVYEEDTNRRDESIEAFSIEPHISSSFRIYDPNHHHQQTLCVLHHERCSDPVAQILYSMDEEDDDDDDEGEMTHYYNVESQESYMNISPPKKLISSKNLLKETSEDKSCILLIRPQVQRTIRSTMIASTTTATISTSTTSI